MTPTTRSKQKGKKSPIQQETENKKRNVRRRGLHANVINEPSDASSTNEAKSSESDTSNMEEFDHSPVSNESSLSYTSSITRSDEKERSEADNDLNEVMNLSKEKEKRTTYCTKYVALLVIVGLLAVSPIIFVAEIKYLYNNPDTFLSLFYPHVKPNFTTVEQFQADFKNIRADFLEQDSKLWKIARIALEQNLKVKDNRQPAVLMLASSQDAYATSQCLARKLSRAFSSYCSHSTEVSGAYLQNMDADAAKLKLDENIEKGFQRGACSALIFRFETIPSYATTTFYQYCENDNAPFKNVAVIFTVQIEDGSWNEENLNLNSLPSPAWDRVVSDFLTKSLKSRDSQRMTDEMVSGLLSRITPSVVWVKKEETLSHC